jgi:hypothetical protein
MKLSQVRLLVDDFPGCFRFGDPDGNPFELFHTIPIKG